jgi:hypothetical protein
MSITSPGTVQPGEPFASTSPLIVTWPPVGTVVQETVR